MNTYDYIIAGAGAAGLSLLIRMIDSGKFIDKKILLVDKEPKIKNDRTWCFWEKENDIFESIVYKEWRHLWFHDAGHSALHDISPYRYKLIRGIDFYEYCFKVIAAQPNITVLYGDITSCFSNGEETYIDIGKTKITAGYIFSSILPEKKTLLNNQYYLLQHFKGWLIETSVPCFDPSQATLMDFRINQDEGTTFVYVMPFSPTRALVEFTLFSKQLIPGAAYDQGLLSYCKNYLKLNEFRIIEKEYGVIPMTNIVFPKHDHHIMYIGAAGGQTKASSGYTFRFIQKQSADIVQALIKTGIPNSKASARRFNFYDSVLLNILSNNTFPGSDLFSLLFSKNKMEQVMKFLDNETSLREELRIISVLPKRVFMKAAIQQL